MDWQDIARKIAPLAPELGGMLGSLVPIPFGGTMGRWAGELLAQQLRVEPTPEAVDQALETKPPATVAAAAQAAQSEAVARLGAIAEIAKAHAGQNIESAKAIGVTQRSEIAAGVSWHHWRHLIGYVTMAQGLVVVAGSAKMMFFGGDIAALAALVTAVTPIFLGLAALNGYVASDSTALKVAAITGQQPQGVVATAVKAATGKR